MAALEFWGGVECTVNRTRHGYMDQCIASGHHDRPSDLDEFARLGLNALRYPVLWERVAPNNPAECDWRWTDERLTRLRDLGIRPIAGLLHHGSGPAYTDLLDDQGFASGLARFARQAAERYPWINDWAPVNEPVTTARFSALYGHWYPHHADEGSFWRALANQVDGTRLAMREIRRVNPAARLIQTDDLGRTYATAPLQDQARHNNLRRWAGWDMLFGRFTPDHPLWARAARAGLGDRMRRIADDPCPPDIVGVNHYLTSDRFLDHRLQRYPVQTHGGDARLAYADTEAVRVLDPAPSGWHGALSEAWARYRTPLALTEVHNGCTREEQMRWAAESWDTAIRLRSEGVDVRAVTAWALLGSHGWDRLLTAPGSYEPGLYDASARKPRRTSLATLWEGLPRAAPRPPAATGRGWWRRPGRLIHPRVAWPASLDPAHADAAGPVVAIHNGGSVLGAALATACDLRGLDFILVEQMGGVGEARQDQPPAWAVIDAKILEDVGAPVAAQEARLSCDLRFVATEPPLSSPACGPHCLTIIGAELAALEAAGGAARAPAIASAALDLLIDGEDGPWQVAAVGSPARVEAVLA